MIAMRLAFAAAALLCFVFPASGQQPEYAPKDGKFSVRFPGKPKENTQTVKTDAGRVKVFTATYAQSNGNTFVATFAEISTDSRDALLDGAIKGLIGKDGKEVSRMDAEIGRGKEPGREVIIEKGKNQMRYRLAVKGDRLIEVGVIGTSDFVKSRDATAFLESLEFAK